MPESVCGKAAQLATTPVVSKNMVTVLGAKLALLSSLIMPLEGESFMNTKLPISNSMSLL